MTIVVDTDIKLSKKKFNSMGEFVEDFSDKIEDIENIILGKFMEEAENSKDISEKEFLNFLDTKLEKKGK